MTLTNERERVINHTYSVRSVDDKWTIGDTVFDVNENYSFYIDGKLYKRTPGLYKLVFMKDPDEKRVQ